MKKKEVAKKLGLGKAFGKMASNLKKMQSEPASKEWFAKNKKY